MPWRNWNVLHGYSECNRTWVPWRQSVMINTPVTEHPAHSSTHAPALAKWRDEGQEFVIILTTK